VFQSTGTKRKQQRIRIEKARGGGKHIHEYNLRGLERPFGGNIGPEGRPGESEEESEEELGAEYEEHFCPRDCCDADCECDDCLRCANSSFEDEEEGEDQDASLYEANAAAG
jgi:hypothetical protein